MQLEERVSQRNDTCTLSVITPNGLAQVVCVPSIHGCVWVYDCVSQCHDTQAIKWSAADQLYILQVLVLGTATYYNDIIDVTLGSRSLLWYDIITCYIEEVFIQLCMEVIIPVVVIHCCVRSSLLFPYFLPFWYPYILHMLHL